MISIHDCNYNDGDLLIVGELIKVYNLSSKFNEMYELYINGEKNYLLVGENNFYVVNLTNGVNQFSVIDGKIMYYHNEDSGLVLKCGGIYKMDYQNRIQDYISMFPYKGEEVRYRSVNASLSYIHFNYDDNLKYVMSYYYDACYDERDKISSAIFYEPFYVGILPCNGNHKDKGKEFYLTHWYEEDERYNVALMKTVGIVNYLTTMYSGEIDVYYDRDVKGNYSLFNLMNAKQYILDDVEDVLIESGLENYVPSQELIDAYNREDNYYKMLLEIYKKYDEFKKESVYVHKLAM